MWHESIQLDDKNLHLKHSIWSGGQNTSILKVGDGMDDFQTHAANGRSSALRPTVARL
jgi:hypothetical protein